jgi:hypothetical protein
MSPAGSITLPAGTSCPIWQDSKSAGHVENHAISIFFNFFF